MTEKLKFSFFDIKLYRTRFLSSFLNDWKYISPCIKMELLLKLKISRFVKIK